MSDGEPEADELTLPDLLPVLEAEFLDGGLAVQHIAGVDGTPGQLVLLLGDDEAGRELRVSSYFMPGVDDPPVMQHFVGLPYVVDPESIDATARFVSAVNAALPMTGFELAEEGRGLAFRNSHAVGVRPLDPGVIAWAWSMLGAAIREFGPLLESVATGSPVDDTLAALAERLDQLVND